MPSRPPQEPAQFLRLLAEARNASSEALGQLWLHCRGYLLLVAHKTLHPDISGKVSPSDIVQETFLEAQSDFARFHGDSEEELLAWLTRILVNNAANATRKFAGTQMRAVEREVPLASASRDSDAICDPADDSGTASQKAIAREEAAKVVVAMQQLPEHYRTVLKLRYEENLTFEDIGALTGRSAEATRKLWARAVAQLHLLLEEPPAS